jgi:flagellar assembly factor FliW
MKTLELLTLPQTRFGDIEYDFTEVVSFAEGLIGFPEEKEFLLVRTPGASSFLWLQSIASPALAFLIVDPSIYVPAYRPWMEKEESEQVFTTVNIPHGHPEEMTLNLAGPIRIDPRSRTGKQIVLDNEAYTTRYRVFAKKCEAFTRVAA